MEFVSRIREKARQVQLREGDLVAICLAGAKPSIRTHLAMQTPKTLKEPLDIPIARDESLGKPEAPALVNVVNEIRELREEMKTKSVKFDPKITDMEEDWRDREELNYLEVASPRERPTPRTPNELRPRTPPPYTDRYRSTNAKPMGYNNMDYTHPSDRNTYGSGRTMPSGGRTIRNPPTNRYCFLCYRQGHYAVDCRTHFYPNRSYQNYRRPLNTGRFGQPLRTFRPQNSQYRNFNSSRPSPRAIGFNNRDRFRNSNNRNNLRPQYLGKQNFPSQYRPRFNRYQNQSE